jgi:hypothetical protein
VNKTELNEAKTNGIEVRIAGAVRDTEFRPEGHDWFFGTLDREQITKIVKLSKFVRDNGLYSATFFDFAIDVYDKFPPNVALADIDVVAEDSPGYDYSDPDDSDDAPGVQDIDCLVCNVTDSDVYWTWSPPHGSGEIEGYGIAISELVAGLERAAKKAKWAARGKRIKPKNKGVDSTRLPVIQCGLATEEKTK